MSAARPPGSAPRAGGPPAHTTGCPGEACITCSDAAVAVTIVRLLDDGLAVVRAGRGQEEVSVALVPARPGDTVLVHAGEAIAVVPEQAGGERETGR